MSCALPGDHGVGRPGIGPGEVELSVDLVGASAGAHQPGLAVVAQRAGGNGHAGHVVVHGELDLGIAGDLLEGVERADLTVRQPDRALAIDADGIDLKSGGSDEHDGVEIGGLQGQGSAVVLQQHGCIFAGLLDDLGVGLNRLRGDLVLGLAVEVAEVGDLIEHAAGGAGQCGIVDRAVFQGFCHFLGVKLEAPIAAAGFMLANRLFGNGAAEHVAALVSRLFRWRRKRGLQIEEGGDVESAIFAGLGFAGHLHIQSGVDEVDGVNRTPVGGDEALEADLVAQNLGQRGVVAAGEGAVHAVVRAHDRGDVRATNGRVERGHIDLVQRLAVDEDVAGVRVVGHVVLDLRHNVL